MDVRHRDRSGESGPSSQLSGASVNQPRLVHGSRRDAIDLDGVSQWIDFSDPVSPSTHGEHDDQWMDQAELISRDDAAIVSNGVPATGLSA